MPKHPASHDKTKPNEFALGAFLVASLATAAGALLLFGWLAEEVIKGDTNQFDATVRGAVHDHATPLLTSIMKGFSFLGSATWVLIFILLVVCASFYFKRPRIAGLLAITMIGASTLDYVLKISFHRPRPVAFFGAAPSSYSFPSGHALGSLCFYGILASVLSDRMRPGKQKYLVWTAAAFLIAMIGLSRVYLGVHYPSDVIAGYLAGAVWVTAITVVDKILLDRREKKINLAKILE
jgi:membrane-associated phospholipid phosphatase